MFKKTINYMNELVETKKIPGISFAFITKEKIDSGLLGLKQIVPDVEILEENTLYDMASLTKVICTTTIVLKLIEEDKVDIDTPLHHYLPEFLDEKVTIRELLTHTSDINPYIPNRDQLNQDELKSAILALKSGRKKGEKCAYTDTGTVLLGFLIEEFYKKSVHEVFKEEVLLPLEMTASGFTQLDLNKVAPTEMTEKRGLIKGQVHDPKAFVLAEHCGSAGLFSTLSDVIKFSEMLLNKGKYKDKLFLSEKTVENLSQNYSPKSDKARSLGWDLIEYENRYLLYHTGYTGTFMILDILAKEGFIFLSNRVHPADRRDDYLKVRDKLVNIYLAERQEKEKML